MWHHITTLRRFVAQLSTAILIRVSRFDDGLTPKAAHRVLALSDQLKLGVGSCCYRQFHEIGDDVGDCAGCPSEPMGCGRGWVPTHTDESAQPWPRS